MKGCVELWRIVMICGELRCLMLNCVYVYVTCVDFIVNSEGLLRIVRAYCELMTCEEL